MKREHLPTATVAPRPSACARLAAAWQAFWFTPADPTLLGFMRACCGLITLYTIACHSFVLTDFYGPHAWYDIQLRHETLKERPVFANPLDGRDYLAEEPRDEFQAEHANAYQNEFHEPPPPPYPATPAESDYVFEFRRTYKFDLRYFGLHPPQTTKQRRDLKDYAERWRVPMPAYPESEAEVRAINDYFAKHNIDPRRAYDHGNKAWSIWVHVTDPAAMWTIHLIFVFAALCFTLGLGTRVSTFITWFGALCYIHRTPTVLFGVDTMMNILLIYLMIGPSGAAFSLDRVLARWWAKKRGQPFPEQPPPSVSANFAIRLLQIHVCIIYGVAGLSKLLGAAWWNGTALWAVLANFEFAPMQYAFYTNGLRLLARNQLVFETFLTCGSYFTLAFEIGYPFLIWRPNARWLYLGAAILLHGVIGLFMGLKTFALIMLVMNMAFLRPKEVHWMLQIFEWDSPATAPPPAATPQPVAAPVIR